MEAGESVDDYNQKFWDYYLQVLPFRKISRKTQMEKVQGRSDPKDSDPSEYPTNKGYSKFDACYYSGQFDVYARSLHFDVTASRYADKKEA